MHKPARLIALVLCLALSAANAALAQSIKIGDINSYKRLPAFTVPYRQGAVLAIEEVNAAGGVLGRDLEFVSRDDQGEPGEALKIAEELFARDGVALISGTYFSNVGLALTSYAGAKKRLFVAAEPLADAITWANGNRYTFRLRPMTYTQTAMLAEAAARNPAKRWATIAPNYAYGQEAVANFKKLLGDLRPDVEFVAEQWPGLFKIDAGAEARALEAAKPDAIFNVTFGVDLAKLVREGTTRGLFEGRYVASLLTGEPEYLDPLGAEAPKGWLVTGYPWYGIEEPDHRAFIEAYQERFGDDPRAGALVGYNTMRAIAAAIEKAGTTETEDLVEAMKGLTFESPMGPITFRAIDHQSTMGAWVGTTAVQDGKGVMVDWKLLDGGDYLPDDATVRDLRPADG